MKAMKSPDLIRLPDGVWVCFSRKTIRLNQADFDRWKAAYHAIADLRAELTSIDDWLDGADEQVRKRWFHSVSRML
jgi:hypothetical protein